MAWKREFEERVVAAGSWWMDEVILAESWERSRNGCWYGMELPKPQLAPTSSDETAARRAFEDHVRSFALDFLLDGADRYRHGLPGRRPEWSGSTTRWSGRSSTMSTA